ncbi:MULTISPECIES: hypothetical protein [Actinomadura]|uniref:Uncharacterized protein n=1 Tax=Actinomadura yumaensis TaxID=111807 RepID=A0ABW2CNF4_9ACTN|nr:hypothetical protein [Actinomadura sp. J1-007]MWK36567.1 hypothetical protein [Actinomadura sp. J1-007]
MSDPMTLAIATAAAGKVVEVAGEPAREAVAALVRRIRERFRGDHLSEQILEGAARDPDSPERLAELDEAIARTRELDPAFDEEVRALWDRVRTDASASGDGVTNVFNGRADKVVQARDIHGGLHLG